METATNKLPVNTPLMAKTADAVRLFGLSRTTLYRMRRDFPDFKAFTIKTGREILFDVPKVYEWLQTRCGGELD